MKIKLIIIIEFLNKQKEKDIEEFELILKQVGNINISNNNKNIIDNNELENKVKIFLEILLYMKLILAMI